MHFSKVPDPRKARMCDHLFLDIVFIAVLAVICGADGWDEIHDWAVSKHETLERVLALPNGIPSADTFVDGTPDPHRSDGRGRSDADRPLAAALG